MKPISCPNCHRTCVPQDGFCPYCHTEVDTAVLDEITTNGPLKICCEFCGSYIEPDGSNCPNCGAAIGTSIKAQEEKRVRALHRMKEKEEEEKRKREQQEQAEKENEQIMRTVGNILSSFFGTRTHYHPFRRLRYFFANLGRRLITIITVACIIAIILLFYKFGLLDGIFESLKNL